MRNITKRLAVWAIIVGALLLIPFFGNWPWTRSDFVFGSVMLFGAATVFEFLTRNITDSAKRLSIGFIVFVILALLWGAAATGFGI